MKLLGAADHRRMAWKNGGGETLEVAVFPPDAAVGGFDWRVSMAVVAIDGPFSLFPGIDRTLALLDGAGLTLDIMGHGIVSLAPDSDPCAFPGDVETMATLTGGPITDLNVMTARGRYRHAVERLTTARDLRPGPFDSWLLTGVGLTVEVAGDGVTLAVRDVLLLEPGEMAHVLPSATGGLLATIRRIV